MSESRLQQQIQFILEADRLKTVLRQNFLADRSRQENSAEHSWHIILMAHVLAEHFPQTTDMGRVAKMLAIHDMVEILCGDTFAYDEKGHLSKAEKEQKAALEIFGKLPADQAAEYLAFWNEFEDGKTNESRAAAAADRLQPFLLNYYTEGIAWRKHGVRREQIAKRMESVCSISESLRALVTKMLNQSVQNGWVKP
jgi:putative hydrolases of HD superfamily